MKYKLIIDADAVEEVTVVAHGMSLLTQRIEELVNSYSGVDFLMGYCEDELRRVPISEIECITILNRKVTAIDIHGIRYTVRERLRDLEAVLPSNFIRINKSSLANEHRIKKFNAAFNGGVDVVFQCGYREYVSRRCFPEIKRRYEGV